ncbi:hypothetical protein J7M23_10460 [Candidatus Sumerlaeota bacterium]|nr:hypothetical protein [Candidatus Sumerlaeota bacterium]
MPERQILINVVLLLIIIGLGVLVVTSHYTPPQSPVEHLIKRNENVAEDSYSSATQPATETTYAEVVKKDIFPHFGERNIFKTLIPKPTPVPAPTRTPKPDPPISVITRHWKLIGILGDKAMFNDRGKREDFFMKEGDTKMVNYRGKNYPITLSKIDKSQFSVTLTFKDQSRTLKMF